MVGHLAAGLGRVHHRVPPLVLHVLLARGGVLVRDVVQPLNQQEENYYN